MKQIKIIEVNELISRRRSIRSYEENAISKEEIFSILEAGRLAPSGCNMQSSFFTVVTNKKLLDEINIKTKDIMKTFSKDEAIRNKGKNPKYHIFFNAPCVIIVSYHKNAVTPIEDISAASQNMLLQGEQLGIGGCWIGNVKPLLKSDRSILERLNIPKDYIPYHAISFGYTKLYPKTRPIKKEEYCNFVD